MRLRNKKTGEIKEFVLFDGKELQGGATLESLVEEWEDYELAEPLIKDEKTKQLFIKYLEEHPDERFMQAVRNFIGEEGFNCVEAFNFQGAPFLVVAGSIPRDGEDTFYWECDELLEEEE